MKQTAVAVASHADTEEKAVADMEAKKEEWDGVFNPFPPPVAVGSNQCLSDDKKAMEKYGPANADEASQTSTSPRDARLSPLSR